MKRKTALVTIPAFCLVLSQTAWAEIPSIVSEDVSEVVTLGEYKGLELEKTVIPVTDEQVDAEIETDVSLTTEDAGDGPVESGDIAVIDYEGKKDGVAFDGGTAEDYSLEIGSGTFIPGFEDGVIGMMKGETKDIELTFPEDYGNEKLAGQDVVFTVTVKSVERIPELSDEWVKKNTDVETIDEYKAQVREKLEKEADSDADTNLRADAYQKIVENSTFGEIPEKDIEPGEKYQREYVESMAGYFGMELEDMLAAQGYSMEEFEEECKAFGEDQAKTLYVLEAIREAENIEITDEDATEVMQPYIDMYQVETVDDLIEMFDEDDIYRTVVSEVVINYVIDNAVITETTAAEETVEEAEETVEEAEEAVEEAAEDAVEEAEEAVEDENTEEKEETDAK